MERQFIEGERTWLQQAPLFKENSPLMYDDILKIKLEAQHFTRKTSQNMIEYFYKNYPDATNPKLTITR